MRSRIKWLNYGDNNTKFFHASTVQRRDKNKLLKIKNCVGGWLVGQVVVSNGIIFFVEIYAPNTVNELYDCLNVIPARVSNDMNFFLTKEVT